MRIKHISVLSTPSHPLRYCDLRFNDHVFLFSINYLGREAKATDSLTCKNFAFIEAGVSCLHPDVHKLEHTARAF